MDLRDLSFLIDHVGDAACVFVLGRVGRSVCHADFVIDIAQQRKREFVLLGELGAVFGLIEADAEDLDVLGGVLVGKVPEPGPFRGSAGCVGLGEEP